MSWTRSSERVALVVLLAVSLAAVGPAAALSVSSSGAPADAAVGEQVSVTVTLEDPFVDMPDTWALQGETALTNVSWTVTVLQQGDQVDNGQQVSGEQAFEQELNADNGGDTVEVELTGTVPAVENYTYDPRQTFTLYDLDQVTGSNAEDLDNASVHHYTEDSDAARTAIDDAQAAIDDAGGDQQAEEQLNRAISAYDSGNFGNAQDLAEDAQSQAEQAQQSQQTMQLAMYGVGALVVLALIGGGIYYWRSQQDETSKLQ
jgi:hypothetical protein